MVIISARVHYFEYSQTVNLLWSEIKGGRPGQLYSQSYLQKKSAAGSSALNLNLFNWGLPIYLRSPSLFAAFSNLLNRLKSADLIGSGSFFRSLRIANINSRSNTVNGSAAINEAVCKASRPPAYSKTAEMAAISEPQTIFANLGGFKLPEVVILARI